MYSKNTLWSKKVSLILAFGRGILVFLLCFLLLEPHLQSIKNYFQKPVYVLAIDNSSSVTLKKNQKPKTLVKSIKKTKQKLEEQGYDVLVFDVMGKDVETVDSIKFGATSTNLARLLNAIKSNIDAENIAGALLYTDGIFNEGYTPLAISIPFQVSTIGLGDTSAVKDLSISGLTHNSTVFQGNSLALEIEITNNGYKNTQTDLEVYQNSKLLLKKEIVLEKSHYTSKIGVQFPVSGSGKQGFYVRLVPLAGEFTNLNNEQQFYVDVISSKKKIVIIAGSPHPDIKAIKSVLESNKFYEVTVVYEFPENLNADLLIAHEYPLNTTSSNHKSTLKKIKIPKWYFVSNQTDLAFLKSQQLLTSYGPANQYDAVLPSVNSSFSKFNLEDNISQWTSDLPPVMVPYGMQTNVPQHSILFYQLVGNVPTQQPLLFFDDSRAPIKTLFLGTGIWKWRLDEYRKSKSFDHFNSLVSKVVQFTMSSTDKKRLFVYPQKEVFNLGETIMLEIEEYNALFEQISGKEVAIAITSKNGYKNNFSFTPLSTQSRFKLADLQEGVYSYDATFSPDSSLNKTYTSSGQFVIQKLNKEAINPVADFDLLQKLAKKNNGRFYTFDEEDKLLTDIKAQKPVSKIHTTTTQIPLIKLAWILIMLILLGSFEWFLRKFYGSY